MALPLIDTTEIVAATQQSSSITTMLPSGVLSFVQQVNFAMDKDAAESLAGPFFGLSLFPYLAFLYFLDRKENQISKGTVYATMNWLTFCVEFRFADVVACKL